MCSADGSLPEGLVERCVEADRRSDYCAKCADDDIYERSPENCPECAANRVRAVLAVAAPALREQALRGLLTSAEFEAIVAFVDYGATRGNHTGPEPVGPAPGPLTAYISAALTARSKLREARLP